MKSIRKLNLARRSIEKPPADSRADGTQREVETAKIRQREKQGSDSLASGIVVGLQPQLEEHVLFVLHPMWAEKGDLL
jgi:hypothetical protein